MKQTSEYIKEFREKFTETAKDGTVSISLEAIIQPDTIESWLEKTLYEIIENLERERSNDTCLGFECGMEHERTRILGLSSMQDEELQEVGDTKGVENLGLLLLENFSVTHKNALRKQIRHDIKADVAMEGRFSVSADL